MPTRRAATWRVQPGVASILIVALSEADRCARSSIPHEILRAGDRAPPGGTVCVQNPANTHLLDTNVDETVDISDVVSVISFLFLGGSPPVLGSERVAIPASPPTCR